VLAGIERAHGVTLRAATLFESPSIRALAARMRTASPDAPSTVVRVQPAGTRTPLFLAPGGGGELFIFEALARAFGPDQPLYVLDMYVFDEIALATTSITLAEVAARMLVDIRAVQPRGPYQIAGYSLGGNISIEIASQLRAAGEEVHLLALLDCDGPDYPVQQPVMQRTLTHVLHALALTPMAGLRYLRSRMGNVARKVIPPTSSVSLYGDQPDVDLVPAHMIESLEQALQPVLDAWERYRPQPYDGRTLIVRADIRQVMIGVVDDDPWLGWKPVLRGEVHLDRLPCDHFTMFHAVNAPQFVAMLEKYLVDGPVQPESTAALAAQA
jgi:thioesterase domain-containing protein